MTERVLHVQLSKDRFAVVTVVEPPGDWFTDAHLQEILMAFADSFYEIVLLVNPRVFGTPRCTFAISVFPKNYRSFIYKPTEDNKGLITLSSISKSFYIRVLGRRDISEQLNQQATIDQAMRIVPV